MNKPLVITGAAVFGIEAIGIIAVLLLHYPGLVSKIMLLGGFLAINLIALVCLVVGVLKE